MARHARWVWTSAIRNAEDASFPAAPDDVPEPAWVALLLSRVCHVRRPALFVGSRKLTRFGAGLPHGGRVHGVLGDPAAALSRVQERAAVRRCAVCGTRCG